MLDKMDAEEKRRLDTDNHHIDKVFEIKKKGHGANKSGHTPHPMYLIPQRRQRTFQDALREDPRIGQLLLAMEKLTPEQVDLVYVIYGEMQFGADVAREQGVPARPSQPPQEDSYPPYQADGGDGRGLSTPHLTEDDIKGIFVSAVNQLITQKDAIITTITASLASAFDITDLKAEQAELEVRWR